MKFEPRMFVAPAIAFILVILLAVAGYAVFSRSYFYVKINGTSMTPQFQDGDSVIFRKVKTDPAVNQIVIFDLPEVWKDTWKGDDDTQLIKRVALVPGDVLGWDGESWYRNGEGFSAITNGTCEVEPMEITLGAGEYFVTGDATKTQTLDSREAFCLGLPYLVNEDQIDTVGTVAKIL